MIQKNFTFYLDQYGNILSEGDIKRINDKYER